MPFISSLKDEQFYDLIFQFDEKKILQNVENHHDINETKKKIHNEFLH